MTLLSFQIFRGLHKAARNLQMPFSGNSLADAVARTRIHHTRGAVYGKGSRVSRS